MVETPGMVDAFWMKARERLFLIPKGGLPITRIFLEGEAPGGMKSG